MSGGANSQIALSVSELHYSSVEVLPLRPDHLKSNPFYGRLCVQLGLELELANGDNLVLLLFSMVNTRVIQKYLYFSDFMAKAG